jgi:peptide/nickel transport system ATP-binding protein
MHNFTVNKIKHVINEKLPLLQIKNLTICFPGDEGPLKVIDNVTFDVKHGEVLGIVGESGSGKTLSSLSIMRLLPNNAQIKDGHIYFRTGEMSQNILELDEKAIQKIRGNHISMIFQEPMSSLNPGMRCGEQVEEIIRIHHPNKTKDSIKNEVLALFEKVKLPDIERAYTSYIHQLSGGQLQRIMIAMAIANKPKLIIADEPTTALDVTVQKSILELLLELKKEFNCSIIFISHDLSVIKKIADRVIVMQKGIVVENGTAQRIFEKPNHIYTKGLIACRPPLTNRYKKLPTVADFFETEDNNQESIISKLILSKADYEARLESLEDRPNILEVKNLSKFYPAKRSFFGKVTGFTKAVNDVSFNLRKGETLGLVGESGCGKSTLGKTLLRLIEPTKGSVLFNGTNVGKLNSESLRKLRRDFQIIFQDPYSSLNPRMRIGDAIKEPMDIHKIFTNNKERINHVKELLEIVGMNPDHYDRYPHQFSGGQRQRINIARTLSLKPQFIVCDESVSALDVSIQAQVLNLLSDLKAMFGLSYLFISHDISVVKHISDRILVMQNGVIVEEADSETLVNNPKHPYTQTLIDAIPK